MTEDEKLRLNELLIDTDNIDTKSDAIENNQVSLNYIVSSKCEILLKLFNFIRIKKSQN